MCFPAPEYDVIFQFIPGRNGDLILPNGRYPNVQVTYSVFLPAKSIAELAEKNHQGQSLALWGAERLSHTVRQLRYRLHPEGGVLRELGY